MSNQQHEDDKPEDGGSSQTRAGEPDVERPTPGRGTAQQQQPDSGQVGGSTDAGEPDVERPRPDR